MTPEERDPEETQPGDATSEVQDDILVEDPAEPTMGLARTIAKAGYASRRQAEEMVRSGRVLVNGKRHLDPYMAVTSEHEIKIDGSPVVEFIRSYFAFNKPSDVTTSPSVGHRHKTLSEFLPRDVPGLLPAGRLDVGTTGLLLLSNDCSWNAAAASGHGQGKGFHVTVRNSVSDNLIEVMAAGVKIPRIGFLSPSLVRLEKRSDRRSIFRIDLDSGKVRQIRALCTLMKLDVEGIHRVRVGLVELGMLRPGRYRALTRDEIEGIRKGPTADG
jgi:23S rRNA pseudouridine2605 synthase